VQKRSFLIYLSVGYGFVIFYMLLPMRCSRRGFLPITGSPKDHKNCKLTWANKIKGMTPIGFELIEKYVFLPLMESSKALPALSLFP